MITYCAPAIWWGEIPSPSRFCADIVDAIAANSVAVVCNAASLPWPEYLSDRIELELAEKCLRVERLASASLTNGDVGQFLLERYATKRVYANYRPVDDIIAYLADNDVLGGMLLFLHIAEEEPAAQWYRFATRYNQRSRKRNVCLCLFCDTPAIPVQRAVQRVLDCHALADDAVLFAGLLASYRRMPVAAQAYVARLAVSLADGDIALVEKLVCETDLMEYEPAIVMEQCESCKPSGSFALRVWKAQIQTLFHLLEEKRLAFVDTYRFAIEPLLPYTDSFGNIVATPEDAEWGILAHMIMNDTGKGRLILNRDIEDTIFEFKGLRNKLAHRQPLSLYEVTQILEA